MNKIICDIHNGEQNSRKTIEFLSQNSSYTWIGNYPIALINEKSRITDKETLHKLEKINFFNAQGFSKHSYTQEEINYLKDNVPEVIKTAYALCLKKPQGPNYKFKEKFEHDRWKKVLDEDNFEALIELSKFTDAHDNQTIETQLRDIMRSAKEIPSLKSIGFVWIVTVPKTSKIEDILELYFADKHVFIQKGRKTTYIAWANTLSEISMREFVYTPLR